MTRSILAVLLAGSVAFPAAARAAEPPDPAAFAADLTAEIDLATVKAKMAMSLLRAVRCVSAYAGLAECRLAITRFLAGMDALTAVLERVESKTGVLVFDNVVDRMSEAQRRVLADRYETLIKTVPFPPEFSRFSVPTDMLAQSEAALERYYSTADGIWNPAIFAFGDGLMKLIERRSSGASAPAAR